MLLSMCPDAKGRWSGNILVKYEYGASQMFDNISDVCFLSKFDPNLNEHGAKTQAEPSCDQLCYGGTYYCTPTDAPCNIVNDTDGRRETQRLRENGSPFILQSEHYSKIVKFPSFNSFLYKLRGADVEQFYNGSWNSVTVDDDQDLNDAEVVCRQLGLGGAMRATTGSVFGQGTGMAILSNVDCTGNETALGWCLHSGWTSRSCSQAAGVVCEGKVK